MSDRELPNYWPGSCFGCSSAGGQGLQLRFWLDEAGCHTRCTLPGHLCGFDGLAHGGVVALLLDEIAQWTLIGRLARLGLTREATVRYRRPVPTGQELLVSGHLVAQDDHLARIQATIHAADGLLLAEGESQWALKPLSAIARISGADEQTLRRFLANYEA